MEELRKLEQVQATLTSMKSRGIVSSSSSSTSNCTESDRFLVDVALLLLQPYGELGMEKKCKLMHENLPKISALFQEEALPSSTKEGSCEKKACSAPQNNYGDIAMIGLESMQNANSTLEDFCRSYFMFHNLDVNHAPSIFRYLPMLSFTESYIYQLDRLNEKTLKLPTAGEPNSESNQAAVNRFIESFETDLRPLAVQLEHNELLTERIKEEFRSGEEYWALERKLCCEITSNKKILVEDVMRAIHLKSFDYRVLNLLLYKLRGEEVNDLHMEFLSVSEFLVELSDDLFDYEEDVLENSFNVLRMFLRIYGASEAPTKLAKCIGEAEDKYNCLLKALDPKLTVNYQKRCEEATREGGKVSGPSLGTWSIPPVIEDEDSYRFKIFNST